MSRAAEANRLRRDEGIAAALRFAARLVRAIVVERLPRAQSAPASDFDRQFGTDTSRKQKLHRLDILSPNYRHAIYYEPSDAAALDQAMARLPIRHQDFTFVDYGSGKGLVVLRAAAYPFRAVVGVEFARQLWETARRNLELYPAALRKAPVEFVLADAVEFTPPAGDLVLYLYEPFEAPVTRKFLERVAAFAAGRRVWIVYVWSKNRAITCKDLWDAAEFLTAVDQGDGWTIYTGRHDP